MASNLILPAHMRGGAKTIVDSGDVPHAIKNLDVIDPSTIQCLEFRILLKVASVEILSSGGIYRPATDIEKELFSKCTAEIISFGDEAFCLPNGEPIANRPVCGDKVMIAKYAGITVRDAEFNLYRFANDKDVVATIRGDK